MKLFNDIRNFIEDKSFKIIIYNNLIGIINFKELIDINSTTIKILSDKQIIILGKNLSIVKKLDNEILIKGLIGEIKYNV